MKWRPFLPVVVLLIATTARAQDAPSQDCFDLAVVAKVGRPVPRAIEAEPDSIVIIWPWDVSIRVLKVIAGNESRRTLPVVMNLHSGLNPRIRAALFLLEREDDGAYQVVDFDPDIVRDLNGRWVAPVLAPLDQQQGGWRSSDYGNLLKPIHYRPSDAWWLTGDYVGVDESQAVMAGRAVQNGNTVIARQGLYLDEVAQHPTFQSGRCQH